MTAKVVNFQQYKELKQAKGLAIDLAITSLDAMLLAVEYYWTTGDNTFFDEVHKNFLDNLTILENLDEK